jgi:hypothetical protein
MKGSISEFELGILRSRMLDAARSKARRGELRISVPIGYLWHREIGLGLDPDRRIQEVTRRIFQCFRELGSARQVHLALKAEGVHFPRPSDGKRMTTFDWTPIRYRNVISVLKNPFYAGTYAYGKSVNRTQIVDGGRNSNAIKRSSLPMPMVVRMARSPAAAAAPCSAAFWFAAAAAVGWPSFTPDVPIAPSIDAIAATPRSACLGV